MTPISITSTVCFFCWRYYDLSCPEDENDAKELQKIWTHL